MAEKYVSVSKLKKHYSWWDGELSEMKQTFDDIILVQPEANVDDREFSTWSAVCTSEDRMLIKCEVCGSEFDVATKDFMEYQRCPHCGAYMLFANTVINDDI